MSVLYYAELDAHSARAISRLERKLHPPELREGETAFRSTLENADLWECNLSFGLYDGPRLVGYLIAYASEKSAVGNDGELVIYVRDIAILPAYRSHVRSFLNRLLHVISAFWPGLPIEAHARGRSLRRWTTLRRVLEPHGYRITVGGDIPGSSTTESRRLLRWEKEAGSPSAIDEPSALPVDNWSCDIGGDSIEVVRINEPRQWLTLRPVWDQLLRATPGYTVFQSFDYLWHCWKYFGFSGELCVLAVRRAGAVIGVAPLSVFPRRIMGAFFRTLGFIGAPWEVDRARFLFGDEERTCLQAVLRYLFEHRDLWDFCEFYEQRLDDPTTEWLAAEFASAGCLTGKSSTSVCPYIKTDGSWTEFLATVPRRLRKNLRRSRRMLQQSGEVRLETIDQWPELNEALDSYREIERRSWKVTKDLAIASDTSHLHFYRQIARVFSKDRMFQLRFLNVNGQRIAGTFGLLFDGVFYSLKIAHDRRFDPLSPGTYLESLELESCFQQDVNEYDFLGGFLKGKLRWTSDARETAHQFFYRRTPRLFLFWLSHFVLKRRLRGALERIGILESLRRWQKQIGGITTRLLKRPVPLEERRARLSAKNLDAGR